MSRSSFFRQKERIFDTAESGLIDNFSQINSEIFRSIQEGIRQFDIQAGAFIDSADNLQKMAEIQERIESAVLQSGYRNRVSDYLTNFDNISEINAEFHSTVNQLTGVSPVINRRQNIMIGQTVNRLLGSGVNQAFAAPVAEQIQQYVLSGTSIAEATENLRKFVLGDEKLGGLERYVKQVAGDAIRGYDGSIQNAIQKEYDLNAISYEGSLINDSRPQCVRWVREFGGIILLSELENEIAWAETNGSGWIEGTTKETFFANRGGYNCRHSVTATQSRG